VGQRLPLRLDLVFIFCPERYVVCVPVRGLTEAAISSYWPRTDKTVSKTHQDMAPQRLNANKLNRKVQINCD
jgi:hypothetical protein